MPCVSLADEEKKEGVDKSVKLERIVVTSPRTDEVLKVEIPVVESTYQVGATMVDVLDGMSGIDIGRTSLGTPNNSMVKIRGLGEDRYIVNLDGRPLTGAGVYGGYYVDWSMLSLQDIEKIEVIKGAYLAEYGNTLGGVINVIPKEPTEKLDFRIAAGIKEYDTYDVHALISKRTGPFGIVVGGGYQETDGYLRNNYMERKDISAAFSYYLPGEGKIKIGVRYNEGEYGMIIENMKGSANYDSSYPESDGDILIGTGFKLTLGDGSYYQKERYEWDVVLEKNLFGIDWEARYYLNDEDRTDYVYEETSGALAMKRDAPPDYSWGWSFKGGKVVSNHTLKAGVEGNYLGYGGITYKHVDKTYIGGWFEDSEEKHELSKVNSAFIQDRWSLLSNLDIYLGLRVDDYKGDDNDDCEVVENTPISPKFGIFYSPMSDLETFVTVARAVNFPTLPKYYWYYNGHQPTDRKALTFEDSMQYEIGGTYKGIRDTSISAKVYHYDIDDYLRWIFGTFDFKSSRVVYNIDNVKLTGFELDVESKLFNDVYAFANYTYQITDKEGDILDKSNISDEISELPEHKFNVGIQYKSDDGALARLTLKWVDSREVPISAANKADTGKMDSYSLLNCIIKYPVIKDHSYLYAGCENILDEEYEESYGYPMPDRMFYGGIEIRF
ncbi:MAG: TonB-dependent receptor [Desulfobacteraceae bacterium]|nr:TonB-dependent receptor [Desulfobacteraceae bacterium]MBC2720850.1 TonB-dependent receptor [Desulfobacteraceae bacterium]